jgi:stage V sporulation protein SpoVS
VALTDTNTPSLPRTGPERAIRVAKTTVPSKLASAIQQALLRHDTCDVTAMGAEATSRAAVAIALASGALAAHAFTLSCRVYLTSTPSPNGDRPLRGVLFRLTKSSTQP